MPMFVAWTCLTHLTPPVTTLANLDARGAPANCEHAEPAIALSSPRRAPRVRVAPMLRGAQPALAETRHLAAEPQAANRQTDNALHASELGATQVWETSASHCCAHASARAACELVRRNRLGSITVRHRIGGTALLVPKGTGRRRRRAGPRLDDASPRGGSGGDRSGVRTFGCHAPCLTISRGARRCHSRRGGMTRISGPEGTPPENTTLNRAFTKSGAPRM